MTPSDLALQIDAALRGGTPVEQPAAGTLDLARGYETQDALLALRLARGERLVGLKMAFTNEKAMQRLGVSEPGTGHLMDTMHAASGAVVVLAGLNPRAEAEVAFLLGADLPADASAAQVRAAVQGFAPAIELVSSRYRALRPEIGAILADDVAGFRFITGAWQPLTPEVDFAREHLVLERNGAVAAEGPASAILGDPLISLATAARLAAGRGRPLRRGQIVMAGTATEPLDVAPGDRLRVRMGKHGVVDAVLAPAGAA